MVEMFRTYIMLKDYSHRWNYYLLLTESRVCSTIREENEVGWFTQDRSKKTSSRVQSTHLCLFITRQSDVTVCIIAILRQSAQDEHIPNKTDLISVRISTMG